MSDNLDQQLGCLHVWQPAPVAHVRRGHDTVAKPTGEGRRCQRCGSVSVTYSDVLRYVLSPDDVELKQSTT